MVRHPVGPGSWITSETGDQHVHRTMLIVGWVAGIVVIGALLLDEGQVVTLLTHEDGREYETQVWIVEVDDTLYIRSNQPDSEWLERIDVRPEVGLRWKDDVGAEELRLRAKRVVDPKRRERVNAELARKHGLAEAVWSSLVDRGESVVLELVPVPEPGEIKPSASSPGSDS